MLCYLNLPTPSNFVLAAEIDDDTVQSVKIVRGQSVDATISHQFGNLPALEAVRNFVEAYFDSNASAESVQSALRRLLPKLAPAKTPFAQLVRNTLLQRVAFGDTATYAELACMIGNPRSVRAVGQALKNNPFHIIVPCHRIVSKDADKVYYAAGDDIKLRLLHHEALCIHAPMTAQIPF